MIFAIFELTKTIDMKFLPLFLFVFTISAQSQKIVKNEIDEFTGAKVLKTSWIVLKPNRNYTYTRLRKLDTLQVLDLKIVTHEVLSVGESDALMLKSKQGEVLKLYPSEYVISERGGGSTGVMYSAIQGVSLTFFLEEENIEWLQKNQISKFRLYTSQGYIETELNEKNNKKFDSLIALYQSS